MKEHEDVSNKKMSPGQMLLKFEEYCLELILTLLLQND